LVRTRLATGLSNEVPSFDEAGRLLRDGIDVLAAGLPSSLRLISADLRLSPFTRLTAGKETRVVLLTQSYEFSASHRLSCVGLSDVENFQLFGKCSNPNGHGHNYLLEITVAADGAGIRSSLTDLDRKVKTYVIEPFDHKNLNLECSEFADLNPTVENIAQVIFDRLEKALTPLRLSSVRVWETAKTYAECWTSRTIR